MSSVVENETEDLEALFEQIAAKRDTATPATAVATPPPATAATDAEAGSKEPYDVFQRVGNLTRNLHDALRELGYDKSIDAAVGKLPDARSRLSYIANLTGQAAEKALSKAEIGTGIQQQIETDAVALATKWKAVFAGTTSVDEFKQYALDTQTFLNQLPERTGQASALFTDIMLAQDFHDLTGQVINKIVGIAQSIEDQLVKLLVDTTPPEKRGEVESEWLNGPVIDTKRDDVVNNQGQVDDLLASLGF
ncbi:MAG: protein phosphatase CheZ [Burkholderiales bacterium]